MSRVAVKKEECFADTENEDGEKQEDVDSVALTDDEREQGKPKDRRWRYCRQIRGVWI